MLARSFGCWDEHLCSETDSIRSEWVGIIFTRIQATSVSGIPVPLLPRWLRYLGVVSVAGVLLYFSVLTTPPVSPPEPGPLWDKKLHFVGYGALTLALAYATVHLQPWSRRIALVVVLPVAYGLLIEGLQLPQPTRYASFADALANLIGALLASLWFIIEPRLRYLSLNEIVTTPRE